MPTYEYRCRDCGHEFEAVQSFTDDALTECPSCQGALKKKFGNVGISFKGSGFYKTDSRPSTAGAKSEKSTAEKEPTKTAASGSEGKSETTKTASSSPDSSAGSSSSSAGSSGDTKAKAPA